MICPECQTDNPDSFRFCVGCGTRLRMRRSDKLRWVFVLVLFLVFGYGIFYLYQQISQLVSPGETSGSVPVAAAPPAVSPIETRAGGFADASPEAEPEILQDSAAASINVPVGTVTFKGITGTTLAEVPAAVVGGRWVALARRQCLGGYEWFFQLKRGVDVRIQEGILNDFDAIGLWRVQVSRPIDGPPLYPWSAAKETVWIPLFSGQSPEPVTITETTVQGYFTKAVVVEDVQEPGLFLQEEHVVGWSFGEPLSGAYLWNQEEGRSLTAEIRVDDFYRISFANSREEELVRAMSMGSDFTALEQLTALAEAFRYESRLPDADRPEPIQSAAVIGRMRELVNILDSQGLGAEVAAVCDEETLVQAGDAGLLQDVVRLTADAIGFEPALQLADAVSARMDVSGDKEAADMADLLSSYYRQWIATAIERGEIAAGWEAFGRARDRLPEDPEILLMGVRLALAGNDWAEAERLLSMRQYPPGLRDTVSVLQARISELKADEGRIAIRFPPGTTRIPVRVTLNGRIQQTFIVDTGASLVTIPTSTAEDLGLTASVRSPLRTIYTAGGVIQAPEVMLGSIELEGWEVSNIRALIVDLPQDPDLGLLGLNYLSRFRMDLNSDSGVLWLVPK